MFLDTIYYFLSNFPETEAKTLSNFYWLLTSILKFFVYKKMLNAALKKQNKLKFFLGLSVTKCTFK